MISNGVTGQSKRKKQQGYLALFGSSATRKQVQQMHSQGQMPAFGIYG